MEQGEDSSTLLTSDLSAHPPYITASVLDELHAFLQNIPCSISVEVGIISQELRGEKALIGECTDHLETKFDDLVQYVHVLEEENLSSNLNVSQIQLQEEDLENRQRCQNLWIRGVTKMVSNAELRPCLLGLFISIAPSILYIDWHLDHAHQWCH